ncbi:MAG: transcription termination/antitermination protein NusA [Alphaproteobacteria bacterium]|nr:transcription termination/antitermination protein NusA [Alphaproteobacteria bacterium]
MMSELERLVETITREKNIPRDVVVEILESAVEAAARKKYGQALDIEAQYNDEIGEVELFKFVRVVEEVEDEDTEISLDEARDLDEECEVGDDLGIKLEAEADDKNKKGKKKSDDHQQETSLGRLLGRIAAQTAKQVIIQKVRDAERELTFNEFKDRKGELITGIVRRFEKGNIIVDLNRAEAILPRREQVPTETYRQGDRIQAYVLDITRATRQPQVVLSRTHPGLLMKLFEMEVPEIYEGIVRIEACAREPGHRAKIAVSSTDSDVDPVGACVGLKGSRVQAVVGELRGEAIDIIPWHPNPARFIQYAIAPAQVSRVYIDESTHTMELVVPDDQLAKAIGRRGQNVRLAAQLTGWRIDIFSESKHQQMLDNARSEIERIAGLEDGDVDVLVRAGFQSAQELADSEASEVAAILEIDEDAAQGIIESADAVVEQLIMEESERRRTGDEAPV